MSFRTWIKAFIYDIFKAIGQLLVAFLFALLVVAIIIPSYQEAKVRSNFARVRHAFRDVHTALEAYYLDHKAYPRPVPLRDFAKKPESLGGEWDIQYMPLEWARGLALTAVDPGLTAPGVAGLTTPVAYLGKLPADPFINRGEEKDIPFAYLLFDGFILGQRTYHEPGWMLISPGPDGDFDIHNLEELCDSPRMITGWKLRPLFYDPKYGANSNGDLILSNPEIRGRYQ